MDSKPTFRMSSAGRCPRALSAQLLGMEGEVVPEFVMRAAEEGNWHEARIIAQLEQEGQFIDCRQKEHTLEYPSFNLIGHIDGVVIKQPQLATKEDLDTEGDGKWQLLEVKTMSQYEFDRWMKGRFEAFPNYAAQITCYMEATGLDECLYIVKNRSSGYEDRQVLTEKPLQMNSIVTDLAFTVSYVKDKELAPADFDPQSIECRRCEYKLLCIPEPKELTALEEQALLDITSNWRKGKDLVDQGQKILNEAREALEQHTKATNQVKWSFNKLAIQLVHYKESVIYSKKKLLATFTEAELTPASTIRPAFDQLRITDLERGEE